MVGTVERLYDTWQVQWQKKWTIQSLTHGMFSANGMVPRGAQVLVVWLLKKLVELHKIRSRNLPPGYGLAGLG
jgi:hypothetical protein